MAEYMAAALRGERPRFVVNPEVFERSFAGRFLTNDSAVILIGWRFAL